MGMKWSLINDDEEIEHIHLYPVAVEPRAFSKDPEVKADECARICCA